MSGDHCKIPNINNQTTNFVKSRVGICDLLLGSLRSGFSLVEMVFATSIFALAFIAITAIFVGITTAQRRAAATSQSLNESQLAFEQLVRNIREQTVDTEAASCNCSGADENFICLKDLTGQHTFYQYDQASHSLQIKQGVSQCDSLSPWQTVSDPNIYISDLHFYKRTAVLEQPLVTIVMQAENSSFSASQRVQVVLQTTVGSRLYRLEP